MSISDFGRFALRTCVAAAMLGECGGSSLAHNAIRRPSAALPPELHKALALDTDSNGLQNTEWPTAGLPACRFYRSCHADST
jgi:hypothetical protein